jgi:hypothetical protein
MRRAKWLITVGLVSALVIGTIGELKAGMLNSAVPKAAAEVSTVTDVRWARWGGRGWGWRRPGIVIGGGGIGVVAAPYYAAPYGGPYWGYPYWGSRSSTCWDRGRRVLVSSDDPPPVPSKHLTRCL